MREARSPRTSAAADGTPPAAGTRDRAGMRMPELRRRNSRIAFAASAIVAFATVAYLLITLDGPHRPGLFALQALGTGVGAAVVLGQDRWRKRLATITVMRLWAASQTTIVGLAMALDGGLTSPLTLLLFVPLLLGALTFRPAVVTIYVAANLAVLVLVGVVTDTLDPGNATILPTVLLCSALVATIAGRSLWELMSQLDAANAELAELARKDSLTGCLDHRSFYEELAAALTRTDRRDGEMALLLADVDHFKRVNDRFGHPAGDEVLVTLASALTDNLRAGDVIGRTGGEEFAVLLPDAGLDDASTVAARIRTALRHLEGPTPLTVSIGIAVHGGGATSPVAMMRAADRAMYAAKHAGRDRIVIAGDDAWRPEDPAGYHRTVDATVARGTLEGDDAPDEELAADPLLGSEADPGAHVGLGANATGYGQSCR